MSKQTRSQDFNYEFEVVFDKDKETTLQKIKRWIAKKQPPLRIVLEHLFSFVEKWYWEGKELQTKHQIDQQVKNIHNVWDEEDERDKQPEIVERGVFGEEGWSISMSNKNINGGSEESESGVGTTGNEIRLSETLPDPWEGDWNDAGAANWGRINKERTP